MKKYLIIAFVFSAVFFTSSIAGASDCAPGDVYNSSNGHLCSTSSIPGCQPGFNYSPINGQKCDSSTSGSTGQGVGGATVDLTASKTAVKVGETVLLKWTSSGLGNGSCSIKNQLGNSIGNSFLGTSNSTGITTPVLTLGMHTFYITCDSSISGYATDSVAVNVTTEGTTPPAQNPTENPLPPVNPPSNTTPATLKVGDPIRVKAGGAVNVRSTPSIESWTRIGSQAAGATGKIVDDPLTTNEPSVAAGYRWWKIDYKNGVDGYSAENFIEYFLPPTGFVIGGTVSVNANATNVIIRGTASASGATVGTQNSGAVGRIIDGPVTVNGSTWWNVHFNTGVEGWVAEIYLVVGAPTRACAVGVVNCSVEMFEKMWDIITQLGREHDICARLMARGFYSDDFDGYLDCAGSPWLPPRQAPTSTEQRKISEERGREMCKMGRDGITEVGVLGAGSAAQATSITRFRWSDYSAAGSAPVNGRPYVSPDQCQTKACVLVYGDDLNGTAKMSAASNITIPYLPNGTQTPSGMVWYGYGTETGYTPAPYNCSASYGGTGFLSSTGSF